MSDVTIDTLAVEITSNSAGAAKGIDDLAASLMKLKGTTISSTAVKNLTDLTGALRGLGSVTSEAQKIGNLADSIKKLSTVGSMNKVINQLNKLPGAVKGLSSITIDQSLTDKVNGLTSALAPLTSIKSGGLGTMVNALGKIGAVTKSLDGDTIRKFADRVEVLTRRLEPLSTKMTTIQAGLKGLNSSAKYANSGMKQLDTGVKVTTFNLANAITVIRGFVSALMPLVRLFGQAIGDAMEWDGISYQFGNAFGEQADEYYEKITQITDALMINKQTFMENSALAASMLKGFGVASSDAREMGLGYTELAYDIWAAYNNIYKTLDGADGAMAAVRSAIAGEVEPIRRAGFTIVESQLEMTAANHGIVYSSEKATEAQKSYLRYLTLVEQAHAKGIVGAYAHELNTAEGLTRTLTQQTKTLAQSFGSLFLPILVKVMPWLQAFVDLLIEAVVWIASFFGVSIQPATWGSGFSGITAGAEGATDAVEDTAGAIGNTTKALEDLKKATIGIDELNVISPPNKNNGSGSGGAGGAGAGDAGWDGLDVESLWDQALIDSIKSQVDDIKAKLEEWLPVIGTIGGALAGLGIATLLKNLGDALEKMNLLQKLFATVAIVAIEAALVFTFADNYLESGNLLYLLGEALVTAAAGYLLFRAWGPGGAVLALGVSILAQLVAIETSLADGTVSLSSPETWIQGISTILMGALGSAVISKYTGFFAKEGFVIGLGVTASLVLLAIRLGAIESGEISSDSIQAWILEIGSVATAALAGKWLGAALYTNGGPMGALIGVTAGLILNLVGTISVKGEDFGNEISDWINGAITVGMTAFTSAKIWKIVSPYITPALSGLIPKIGTALSGAFTTGWSAITGALAAIPVWGWIVAAVVALIGLAVVDYDFTEIGHKIGEMIGKACRWVADAGVKVFDWAKSIGEAIQGAFDSAWNWCKENITWDNIKNFVAVLFKKETWTDIVWPKVKEIGLAIWDGLWEGIWGGVENLWGNITEFVDGFIQGFKDGFEIHSPSKKFIEIGKQLIAGLLDPFSFSSIKEKLSGFWDSITGFFTGKNATTENVTVNVSLVKKGWTTVLGWIGKIPGVDMAVKLVKSGWSTVKTWVGNIPTLSQLIKLGKSGWTSVKKWIGSIPAISQAVKLAKSGWSSVKGWIGSIPTLSASIKLVKSGWTTVKKWLGGLDFDLKFKLPKIKVKWAEKTYFGFTIKYPNAFETYAKGGFPDMGEMFIAREAGPELVGKIGSKTTVANNQQIVEAVSEGVYAAVLAAMRQSENNGSQSVNVYLDGRQITSAVEQRQHERGASLMGRQVYAY